MSAGEEIFYSELTTSNEISNSVDQSNSHKLFENSLRSSFSNDYFVLDKEFCQTNSSDELTMTLRSIKSSYRNQRSNSSDSSGSDSANRFKRISTERLVKANQVNDEK